MVWSSIQRYFVVNGISMGANLSSNSMAGHGWTSDQVAQFDSLDKHF
jgi:hypothetical protein